MNSRERELLRDNQALRDRNSELTSDNVFLRRELGRVEAERNLFLVQDEVNEAIRERQFAATDLPFGTSMSADTSHEALAKG